MEFKYFHDYYRMVRMGVAEPLACETCGEKFALRIGKDDQPILQCFGCNSKVRPGKRVYETIVSLTNKYFQR